MLTDMKKIFYILTVAIALPLLHSCADMLEEENFGNPTIESMMGNEENVVLLVGQAYADLKWVHDHWGYWGVSSLTSDECITPIRMPGEHWMDSYYWKRLHNHDWNWMGDAFKNIWNSTISGAVLCNKLLTTLAENNSSMSETIYKQYVGELEVLRSYYYYLLFDCFGRIPYLEEFVDKTEPLMDPADVWSHLVNCLERNAPNMPKVTDGNRASNYGRVTQGFAYSLLARLYLNAESFDCTPDNVKLEDNTKFRSSFVKVGSVNDFYTNAVACCDEVINSGAYGIEDDYFANFKIKNENSKENIFVLVEDGNPDFDLRYNGSMMNKLRMLALTNHYGLQKTYGLIEKPWNGFCARPTFIDRYNERDVRGPGPAPAGITNEDLPKIPEEWAELKASELAAKIKEEFLPEVTEFSKTVQGYGTQRTEEWGWFVGPIFDKDGVIVIDEQNQLSFCFKDVESLEKASWNAGARLSKYEIDKTGTYAWGENDFVLMRYADVLWMKEEAIKRGGSGVSGSNSADFKLMLKRAFAYEDDPEAAYQAAYPGVVSLTLEDILDERGREFSWEMVRRRDLIRFGKYNDPSYLQYVEATDAYRKWFPIPFSVLEKGKIDENGNRVWTQNEGYEDL